MTYTDRSLNCVDCGVEFIHSAADQEYYQQKGFVSDPKRCSSCRASRRATRDTGYDVREGADRRPPLQPERVAGAITLAVAAAPDRDARPAVDLPRPVMADEGRLLVD
ncbi:MAG: zinc-ribbon domain-containing protein, partial [Chloroflexota bacterium]